MIKNVVFDIGRVLFDYQPEKIIDALAPDTRYKSRYLDILFHSPIWQRLDRGDLSHREALRELSPLVDHAPECLAEMERFLNLFPLHLDLITETQTLFLELKPRFPLYLLSNFQAEPFDLLLKENPFLGLADGMVISAKVNLAKPEPAIYLYLLETYGLTAKETVFIDDLPENIAAAREAGIQGVLFTDIQTVRKELRKLNVLDKI